MHLGRTPAPTGSVDASFRRSSDVLNNGDQVTARQVVNVLGRWKSRTEWNDAGIGRKRMIDDRIALLKTSRSRCDTDYNPQFKKLYLAAHFESVGSASAGAAPAAVPETLESAITKAGCRQKRDRKPDGVTFWLRQRTTALNDASVTVRREAKARPTLGAGLRLGFLGLLHMDVFRQRLRDEFGAEVLFTSPTVPYKVRWKDGNVTTLEALDDWPDAAQLSREVSDILEPVVDIEVVTPREHVGACLGLCGNQPVS